MADPNSGLLISPYGYIPTRWIALLFLSLFSLSTGGHFVQGFLYRMWWIFPTIVTGGVLEIIGWSARLWSNTDQHNIKPFQIQLTTTILGPTPILALNFIILGQMIPRLGVVYSRLSPKFYTIIFCTFDVIALVVQALGGGIASAALSQHKDPNRGGDIVLGGIVFQMVALIVYLLCAVEIFVRYIQDWPIPARLPKSTATNATEKPLLYVRGELSIKLKVMSIALSFNALFLLIRAIYRTIELSDGWLGRIITTEVYFNVLDGAMVALAMYTLNLAHPGLLLREDKDEQRSES